MSRPSSGALALAIAFVFVIGPAAAQPAALPSNSPTIATTVAIAVTLKDGAGKPLAGTTVRLRDAGGLVVGEAVSDGAGDLLFPPVSAGTSATPPSTHNASTSPPPKNPKVAGPTRASSSRTG